MPHDLRESAVVRALADLLGDLSDLVGKEMRLAKAEMTEKLTSRLRGMIWMGVAALLGLTAFVLVIQSAVVALARWGLELHWAYLLVAAALAAIGTAAFLQGRSAAQDELLPSRTLAQLTNDLRTVKERVT